MDIKMKHRIIGIVVLVALAVIFIPFLFSRSEKGPKLASHIPNPPNKPSIELNVPVVSQASVPVTAKSTVPLAVQPLQPATLSNANNMEATPESTTRIPSTAQATVAAPASVTPPTSAPPVPVAAAPVATPAAIAVSSNVTPPAPTTVQPLGSTNQISNQPMPATQSTPTVVDEQQSPAKPVVQKPRRNKSGFLKSEFAALKKSEASHASIKSASMGQAWAVQLGSFGQKTNAEQLVKRLRAKGYDAYIHEATLASGSISRVYVGPELQRDKAEALVEKLQQQFQLKGVVVKYKV